MYMYKAFAFLHAYYVSLNRLFPFNKINMQTSCYARVLSIHIYVCVSLAAQALLFVLQIKL